MSQVLSQSEVDALLAAVSEGEIGADTAAPAASGSSSPSSSSSSSTRKSAVSVDDRIIVDYDLTSQDRIIR